MKAMEHNYDRIIAFFSGMVGGFVKFVSVSLLDISFGVKLMEAGVTAMVCGFLGIAGKNLFLWVKNKYFKKH